MGYILCENTGVWGGIGVVMDILALAAVGEEEEMRDDSDFDQMVKTNTRFLSGCPASLVVYDGKYPQTSRPTAVLCTGITTILVRSITR